MTDDDRRAILLTVSYLEQAHFRLNFAAQALARTDNADKLRQIITLREVTDATAAELRRLTLPPPAAAPAPPAALFAPSYR